MNNTFERQLLTAMKIWLLAVLFNTVFGTLWLCGLGRDVTMIPLFIIFGGILGSLYSIPVLLVILLVINILVRKKANGRQICLAVYLCGLLLPCFSLTLLGGLRNEFYQFLIIADLAGLLSITPQYHAIKKLGSDFSPVYHFDYEN